MMSGTWAIGWAGSRRCEDLWGRGGGLGDAGEDLPRSAVSPSPLSVTSINADCPRKCAAALSLVSSMSLKAPEGSEAFKKIFTRCECYQGSLLELIRLASRPGGILG